MRVPKMQIKHYINFIHRLLASKHYPLLVYDLIIHFTDKNNYLDVMANSN